MDKPAGYFEGILQLRNTNKEVVDFVRKSVDERKDAFISKEKEIKNGIDFYLTSQRFLRALGKKLKNKFNGELKESRKLHTRNRLTSRDVYRVTVLFRLLKFKKWDVVNYKGDKIKIKSIGKLISGIDVKTGKRVSFKADDITF